MYVAFAQPVPFNKSVQGEFEFGEDPPGKRVFDTQIAELKDKTACARSKDQNHAWFPWVTTNRVFKVDIGARHFQISQTKISRRSAPLSLKSLYLNELILL